MEGALAPRKNLGRSICGGLHDGLLWEDGVFSVLHTRTEEVTVMKSGIQSIDLWNRKCHPKLTKSISCIVSAYRADLEYNSVSRTSLSPFL